MLSPERWQEIQALLARLEGLSEDERNALLDVRCAGDPELREEVESLLAASTRAEDYFDDLVERAITGPVGEEEDADDVPSPSLVGRQLGHFEVKDKLGEGGMGEVYLAHDLDLRRDVALKVLPARLLGNPQQVARFRREAQLLASLNHPSIAGIYGFLEEEGLHVLILELVDGPTLASKMSSGRMPQEDALEIAREIALALESAHRAGVVHRDLKPANVKLTERGEVKVLDFGIAKAVNPETENSRDRSPLTPEVLDVTRTGQVIGTVAYMSPEQLKGKSVDTRSDVWAFGALLFEMLAGRRAFDGDSGAETMVSILGRSLDWGRLPSSLPPALRRLLERCLERDVNRRLQAIGEARIVIEDVLAGEEGVVGAVPASGGRPEGRLAAALRAAVVVVALGLSAAAGWVLLRPTPPPAIERFVSPLRAGQEPVFFGAAAFNLANDGSVLVYRGPGSGGSGNRLWVRRWTEIDATPLAGTEGALAPAVSEDGRLLAFSQNGEIKVLSLEGGPSRTIGAGINPQWDPDGYLLVTTPSGTARLSADGVYEPITQREGEEGNHFIIDAFDGRALMSVSFPDRESEIRALWLDSGETAPVTVGEWPRYSESGHLVYLLGGSLMAAPFDAGRMQLAGEPAPIVDGVLMYSLSHDGQLVYSHSSGAVGTDSELVWMSRSGEVTQIDPGWTFDRGGANPGWSLSPDGSRVALRIRTDAGQDVWVKELDSRRSSRFTFHPAEERKPQWSPDGGAITFLSDRNGDLDVWSKPSDGSGEPVLVYDHPSRVAEGFWTDDGEWLVVRTAGTQDLTGGRDIHAVRRGADSASVHVARDYDEASPDVSPDGRWLAYSSNETGRYEIYVRPFPNVDDGRWQVTTQGGSAPQWADNGRELFYVDAARRMMSVTYTTDPRFRVVGSQGLFTIPPGFDLAQVARLYDVSKDGERFLMARLYGSDSGASAGAPEIVLVRNFHEELRERLGR